ncbi:MAG TPA: hypothetical protein VJ085_03015 [Candidatus Acidoferrales bacterium]|nr:hypothetical protein [Candidatus Acidoferrales bacterium]
MGAYELVVLWFSVALSLATIAVCVWKRLILQYVLLNLYLFANLSLTLGGYYIYSFFGYDSFQYFYFYYTTDAVQNIVGYILIGSLFDRLLRGSIFHKYVRPTLILTFLLIVAVSARFLSANLERFYSTFVFEFQQNMYFIGVLLTFLLWISMGYLQAESRRFVLLVSGLGIYFSSHAATYAMQFLFPGSIPVLIKVPPLAYCFMVLLWLYTFSRVPEGEPAAARPTQPQSREAALHLQIER